MPLLEELMNRGMTRADAERDIREAKKELLEMLENGDEEEAYYFCESRWGLEPDYVEELI